jgi:hypothetical protein
MYVREKVVGKKFLKKNLMRFLALNVPTVVFAYSLRKDLMLLKG